MRTFRFCLFPKSIDLFDSLFFSITLQNTTAHKTIVYLKTKCSKFFVFNWLRFSFVFNEMRRFFYIAHKKHNRDLCAEFGSHQNFELLQRKLREKMILNWTIAKNESTLHGRMSPDQLNHTDKEWLGFSATVNELKDWSFSAGETSSKHKRQQIRWKEGKSLVNVSCSRSNLSEKIGYLLKRMKTTQLKVKCPIFCVKRKEPHSRDGSDSWNRFFLF